MLQFTCPKCGFSGEETEFHAGGEAHIVRPASSDPDDVSAEQQAAYLFERDNPLGISYELWHCSTGCGKWFHMARHSVTMEVMATYDIRDPKPKFD